MAPDVENPGTVAPLAVPIVEALARAGYHPARGAADARPAIAGRWRVSGPEDVQLDLSVLHLTGPDDRARTMQRLERWSEVADPALERVVDVVDLGPTALGVLSPASANPTLAGFVAAEGRLSAGRASSVLVVLGRVLARLHHAGEAYGTIDADRVLVVGGRPVLTVPEPGPRGVLPASPGEDAYHLAALVDRVLVAPADAGPVAEDRRVARALGRLAISALGDAADRPGVGTLASRSHDLAPCQPLVVVPPPREEDAGSGFAELRSRAGTGGGGSSRPPAGARSSFASRRPPRPGARILVTVVAVAALGAVALLVTPTLPTGLAQEDGRVEDGPAPPTPAGASGSDGRDGSTGSDGDGEDSDRSVGAPGADAQQDVAPGATDDARAVAAAAADLTRARFDLVADLAASGVPDDDTAWSDVLVLGSAAHTQAVDLVTSLVADGTTLSGLTVTVTSTEVVAHDLSAGTATVAVAYTVSEYAVHSARGARVVGAGDEQRAVLELVVPEGSATPAWRVVSVVESTAAGAPG